MFSSYYTPMIFFKKKIIILSNNSEFAAGNVRVTCDVASLKPFT